MHLTIQQLDATIKAMTKTTKIKMILLLYDGSSDANVTVTNEDDIADILNYLVQNKDEKQYDIVTNNQRCRQTTFFLFTGGLRYNPILFVRPHNIFNDKFYSLSETSFNTLIEIMKSSEKSGG